MEQFVFPAAFYQDKDNEGFVVAFDDIQVYCTGQTVEDAFVKAKGYLKEFCRLSMKLYGGVQEKPRTYMESKAIHKNDIVLLVDADVPGKKAEKIDNIFED